ncbi:hypothetical protein ACNHUS_06670 [Actinomycetes bacterium M1A6_2h]
MRHILAFLIGSDALTVATYRSADPTVLSIDASTSLTVIPVGDDPRLGQRERSISSRDAAGAIAALAADRSRRYDHIVAVHPTRWPRRDLTEALADAGVPDKPTVLSRAEAADVWLRRSGQIDGSTVIVDIDFGGTVASAGGSCVDIAVDGFGAACADRLLLDHLVREVRVADPSFDPNWCALRDLTVSCVRARHRLTQTTSTVVDVRLGHQVRVTRDEYEDLIAGDVNRMASRVAAAVAGLDARPDRIMVHGNAASIPSVTSIMAITTRTPVLVATEPADVVAKGAVALACSVPVAPVVKRSWWANLVGA